MNTSKDKRLLFYQLFKPFAIFVLVIALLACLFMYSYMMHNTNKELDSQLSSTIRSAAQLISTQFEEMERIAYRLELEEDIRPYHAFQNLSAHRYSGGVINSYICANTYLDDVLIYYGDDIAQTYGEKAIFLSRIGIRDVKSLWNYEYKFASLSLDELIARIGEGSGKIIIPNVRNRNAYSLANEHALYVFPCLNDRAMIFLLNTGEIGRHINQQLSHLDGSLSVWDQSGSCILNFGSEEPAQLSLDSLPAKDAVSSGNLGKGVLRTVYSAPDSPYIYVIDWHDNPY